MYILIIFVLSAMHLYSAIYNESCPRKPDAYRIMTFNLRKVGKEDEAVRLWPARAGYVKRLIEDADPDFFGVQEAYRLQLDDIMNSAEIKEKYSWIGRGRKEKLVADPHVDLGPVEFNIPVGDVINVEGEHSSIFYNKVKFKKLDHGTFWLNPKKKENKTGWGEPTNRICSWIKLEDKKNKQIIWIFNTHLAVKKEAARANGLALILSEMSKKVKSNEVAFLIGDFNDKSLDADSPLGKIIRTPFFPMYDTATLTKKKYGPTYSALTHDWKPGNKKIDFITVNDPNKIEVLSQCILSPKGNRLISDHLPVVIDFKIK